MLTEIATPPFTMTIGYSHSQYQILQLLRQVRLKYPTAERKHSVPSVEMQSDSACLHVTSDHHNFQQESALLLAMMMILVTSRE